MKWLVLLMIGLTVAIPTAMAQVPDVPQVIETKGQNYDLVEDYFTGIATWQSHPERIFNGSEWADFIVYDRSSFVQVESESIGSLIYDKNSCSYTIYETGKITPNETPLIPSVSWYPRMAQVGTDDYIGLDDLYNQQCDVKVTQGENWVNIKSVKTQTEDLDPVVIQHANGTQSVYPSGTRDVAVLTQTLQISTDRGIKETVSVFNGNPEWNNHKMAITQTVHTPDVITLGGNDYNISSMNGQTLDKQWIIDNEAEIFQIADSLNYDFDVGINELNAIAFVSEGGLFSSTQKISMDFSVNDSTPYLSSYTVDPTFSASETNYRVYGNSNMDCQDKNDWTLGDSGWTYRRIAVEPTGSGNCNVESYQWDISSIGSVFISTNPTLDTNVYSVSNPRNCDINSIDNGEPSSQHSTNKPDLASDIMNMSTGTTYLDNDNWCTTTGNKTVDLGSTAKSDLQTAISNGQSWWAIGLAYDNMVRDTSSHDTRFSGSQTLSFTYTLPTQPSSPTNLSAVSGQPIELSWTASSDLGGAQTSDMTYKVERSTYEFAESPLPINAQSDSGVDMSTNKLLYHLDGTKTDSTTSRDSSYDGTNSGATTGQTGKIGNAWSFDGSNDYVEIATSPTTNIGTGDFTITFWLKSSNLGSGGSGAPAIMGSYASGSTGGNHWQLYENGGNVKLSDGSTTITTGITSFEDGNWHHLAFVRSSGSVKAYLDAVQKSDQSFTVDLPSPSTYLKLGQRGDGNQYANFNSDDMSFWSRALSSSEISSLYNSGSGAEVDTLSNQSDLIAYYDFEQSSSTLENQSTITTTSDPYIEDTSGANNDSENPILTTTTTSQLTNDFEDASNWSSTGSSITVDSAHTSKVGSTSTTSNDRIWKEIGTISDDWTVQFEMEHSGNNNNFYTSLTDTPDTQTWSSGSSRNSYHFTMQDNGAKYYGILGYTNNGSHTECNTQLPSGSTGLSRGTTYYVTWEKSGTTLSVDIKTGSHSGSTATSGTCSSVPNHTGLNYLQFGADGAGGNYWMDSYTISDVSQSSTSQPTFSTGTIANQIDDPQITVKSSTLFDGTDAHSVSGWTKAVSSAIGTLFSFENTAGETIYYEIETDKVRVAKESDTNTAIGGTANDAVSFYGTARQIGEKFTGSSFFNMGLSSVSVNLHKGDTNEDDDSVYMDLIKHSDGSVIATSNGVSVSSIPVGSTYNDSNIMTFTFASGVATPNEAFRLELRSDTTSTNINVAQNTGGTTSDAVRYKTYPSYTEYSSHDLIMTLTETSKTNIIEATGQSISTSTPSHVMFTRDTSNGWEIFLDGTSIQTATDSTSLGTALGESANIVFNEDGSALTGWTDSNSILSLSGGDIQVSTGSPNHKAHKATSSNLNDDFTFKFKIQFDGGGDGGGIGVFDTTDSSWSGFPSSYARMISVYIANNGDLYTGSHTGSGWNGSSSQLCNGNSGGTAQSLSTGDERWVTLTKTGTEWNVKVYSDSARSNLVCNDTRTFTDSGASMTGFNEVVLFTKWGTQSHNYDYDDIQICNGETDWANCSTAQGDPIYYIGSTKTGTNTLPSLDEFAIWTSDKGSEASDIYDRGANTFAQVGTTTGSTVEFDDSNNLVSGTNYYHRIIANNGAFDSNPSNVSSSTAGIPPDSPTITSIAINDPNASPLDITLQWQNGASMGSGTFQNYVITRSADSSFTTVQTVANPTTTTYTDTVPNAGTWYYKVATTSTHGTSPNSSASNISTPTEPLPITDLAGQADSDVQTSFSWTQPSTGGSNIVQYKLFRDSINIANTTSTSYTDTGLTQNTSYLYNVFSQNNVGTSTKSNDLTLTTHTPVSGNIGGSANTVGATTKLDVTVNITGGSPTPTFSTFTIKEGSTTIATFTGTTYYLQLDDDDAHNYTVESTDSNHWSNPTITGSFTAQADYEPAWDEGLSYDFVRANGTGTLFVNRDLQGWDINCQYRTTAEVMSNSTGITTSASNQWAYYDTQSVNDVDTLYLECTSNNETLFTDTTFAENRIGGGILLLDNVFSDWVGGVPIAMIFVIFVASLFTGRSSPTGILLIVAMVGVMGAIGLFAIDQAIWSLVLLASVLGIFVGKRFL